MNNSHPIRTAPTTGLRWLLMMLTLLLSLSALNVAAASLTGKVIGVLDGDTIDMLDASKVTQLGQQVKQQSATFADIVPKDGQTLEIWGVVISSIMQLAT